MPKIVSMNAWVVCYDEQCGWPCFLLSPFLFFPYWVVIISHAMVFIDNDQFFVFSSYIFLTLSYSISFFVSSLLGWERMGEYANDDNSCTSTKCAFPDPIFFSTVSYTLVFIVGVLSDIRKRKRFLQKRRYSTMLIFISLALYLTATVTNNYFSWSQFLSNILLVVVSTSVYVLIYWRCVSGTHMNGKKTVLQKLFGTNRDLFTKQRYK